MQLFTLGINHHSADLAIRERFAIAENRLAEFLLRGSQLPHVEELLVLSTCNRVEMYGVSRHPRQAQQQLMRCLAAFQGQPEQDLESLFHFRIGSEAVIHGFRVASSLDSMIVGEAQVLGQVKNAYRVALEAGTTGRLLNKFFHRVFHVAKRVRTETQIAAHPVSISYAAIVLAKQIFGDLRKKKALILGAGEMSQLAMKHLQNSGIETFYVANRTAERSRVMAKAFGGESIPFENFEKWLSDVDVVLTSTNAPHYLIDGPMVAAAMVRRKNNPIFFIDIAVPRDVAPEVNQLSNVFLYDVDELGAVVTANKEGRVQEAQRAEVILQKEVEEFGKVLRGFEVVPTISSLTKKFEKICEHEVEKALQKLPDLDIAGREVIEQMASILIKKVLHDPMVTLKEDHAASESVDYASLVRKLFRLDEI